MYCIVLKTCLYLYQIRDARQAIRYKSLDIVGLERSPAEQNF